MVKCITEGVFRNDPILNLNSPEARDYIENTVTRTQDSTVAGCLGKMFPSANISGCVQVRVDPSQMILNAGPQHHFLQKGKFAEMSSSYDPSRLVNVAKTHQKGKLDFVHKVSSRLSIDCKELEGNQIFQC